MRLGAYNLAISSASDLLETKYKPEPIDLSKYHRVGERLVSKAAETKVSKTDLLWLLPLIKDLVGSRTKESFQLAWTELNRVAQSKGKDKLLEWLDESYHEISVYLDFPTAHWSRIKCTNSLERLNEELRRREKCIRIFPDKKSCLRLFGAILQGYSEDWISGKLYLSEPMERIRENQKRAIPFEATRDGLKPCSVGYASSAGLQPVAIR